MCVGLLEGHEVLHSLLCDRIGCLSFDEDGLFRVLDELGSSTIQYSFRPRILRFYSSQHRIETSAWMQTGCDRVCSCALSSLILSPSSWRMRLEVPSSFFVWLPLHQIVLAGSPYSFVVEYGTVRYVYLSMIRPKRLLMLCLSSRMNDRYGTMQTKSIF